VNISGRFRKFVANVIAGTPVTTGSVSWRVPPIRGSAELLRAFRVMPWLRAVTARIAEGVASAQWHLYAPTSHGKFIERPDWARAGQARRAVLKQQAAEEEEYVELGEHPATSILLDPNPMLRGRSVLYLFQAMLDHVGEAYAVMQRGAGGTPTALWPLPPTWVTDRPAPDKATIEVQMPNWRGPVALENLLWAISPALDDPYGRGTGTAEALADELETDEYAAKHTKNWFYNGGRPDLLVVAKGMSKPDLQELESRWEARTQSFWKKFKPYFVNRDVAVQELTQSLQEMQFTDLRRLERDTIVNVFGVPPEVLGIVENSNRATIEAADYLFGRWVLQPRLEFLRNVLQVAWVSQFDPRLVLDYDSPVAEDKEHNLKVYTAAPWAFMVDEWRSLGGQEPLPEGRGRVFIVPPTYTEIPADSTPAPDLSPDGQQLEGHPPNALPAPAARPARVGQLPATPPAAEPVNVRAVGFLAWPAASPVGPAPGQLALPFGQEMAPRVGPAGPQLGVAVGVAGTILPKVAATALAPVRVKAVQINATSALVAYARRMEPKLRKAFVDAVEAARAGVDVDALARLVMAGRVPEETLAALAEKIGGTYQAGLEAALAKAHQYSAAISQKLLNYHLGGSLAFNITNEETLAWVRAHAAELIKSLNGTTQAGLRKIIEDALRGGMTADQLARQIRGLVGITPRDEGWVESYRARLLARGDIAADKISRLTQAYADRLLRERGKTIAWQELMWAENAGQEMFWEAAEAAGLLRNAKRRWLVTPDERLCKVCRPMAGVETGIGKPWMTPRGLVMTPQQIHVRCRCSERLVFQLGVKPGDKPGAPVKPKRPRRPRKPAGKHTFPSWITPLKGTEFGSLSAEAEAEISACRTTAEVNAWLTRNLGIKTAALDGDLQNIKDFAKGMARFQARLWQDGPILDSVFTGDCAGQGALAQTLNSRGGWVELRAKYANDPKAIREIMEDAMNSGFHPPNDGEVADTAMHEMSHHLGFHAGWSGSSRLQNINMNDAQALWDWAGRWYSAELGPGGARNAISRYARQDVDEWIAEHVSAYLKSPKTKWGRPHMKELDEIMRRIAKSARAAGKPAP
jgi:hypothetical protein